MKHSPVFISSESLNHLTPRSSLFPSLSPHQAALYTRAIPTHKPRHEARKQTPHPSSIKAHIQQLMGCVTACSSLLTSDSYEGEEEEGEACKGGMGLHILLRVRRTRRESDESLSRLRSVVDLMIPLQAPHLGHILPGTTQIIKGTR